MDGRKGDVFVQRFTFEPNKDYPDGSSVEFWHNGIGRIHAYNKWIDMADDPDENPYVFESEILSPYARLRPGESYAWTYDWYSCRIGGDFPVADCHDAGRVSAPLTIRQEGASVRLRGRFGVFYRGRLVVELYDAKMALVATAVLDPGASPLKPLVLDRLVPASADVRSMVLVMWDASGIRVGEVARAALPNTAR